MYNISLGCVSSFILGSPIVLFYFDSNSISEKTIENVRHC